MTDTDVFADAARDWLERHAADAPRDYGAILPPELAAEGRAWQRQLFDAGFAGLHWPVEFGGRGLTPAHTAAWVTAAARAQVPPFLNMVGCVLTGGALLAFGTDEQKAEHLRPILTGAHVWCQLFSEPDAGSDLASLTTTAVRRGDRWVVDGQKVWCSNGRVADRGILLARTDPDAPPHRGIAFFLVDMHAAGVETRPLRQMNGAAEFDEVFLTEVSLPADALLGPEHGGWGVAMGALSYMWHGVMLSDLQELRIPLMLYHVLAGLVYLVLGLVITIGVHKAVQYEWISLKRGFPFMASLLAAAIGFFVYLVIFVLGMSFASDHGMMHVVVDVLWQMFEQGVGGLAVSLGIIYDMHKRFLEQERGT